MEQLARIEARLESLTELGNLVGALRSLAASRVREAQEALSGTRAFCAIVERAIAELAPIGAWPERQEAEAKNLLLVITSQNGFAGGFNERLIDLAVAEWRETERLVVVGRRGEIALSERGVKPDQAYAMTSRSRGVTQLARRISSRLVSVASARIVHAHYMGGAGYSPRVRQVLPLPCSNEASDGDVPLHHLPADRLMEALRWEFLFAEVADALMDSLASENAARLRTMDAASRNIDDKLDRLERQALVARQEEMTADMLDVVTGAEAIFGD